jgi:glycolate oxidase FAD binding subunit
VTHSPANAAELSALVQDVRERRTSLRVEGAGTWTGAGAPVARVRPAAERISIRGMSGIEAYVPADFVLTARAGTTLAELEAETAKHGQWCPLLPWGTDEGTLGATFATATTGPCARALGRPRDIALGLEFVDGTGAIVISGGRVVKNVAGFDLTRLVVGSFGSLGIITQVTVRLRARPPIDQTWCLTPRDGVAENTAARAEALRRAEIVPLACEPIDSRSAHGLHLVNGMILVRYAGNRALVDAARASLGDFTISEADPGLWTKLRALDPYPRVLAPRAGGQTVAERVKAMFDPAGILNPGVMGELREVA